MCMLTIYRGPEEIVATMNRDEALTRGPELPPRIHESGAGPAWMAPHDSDRGGTWMGANAHGVIACLLNAYLPGESLLPDARAQLPSRGEIIPMLLEAGDGPAVLSWLANEFRPEAYPSFNLLVITQEKGVSYQWLRNGGPGLSEFNTDWIIRSSAGWDSEEIRLWREERFAEWRAAGCEKFDTLPTFHLMQDPNNVEWSPLMRREWSATRSITQVCVSPGRGEVEMRYWPEPTAGTREPRVHLALPLSAKTGQRINTKAT